MLAIEDFSSMCFKACHMLAESAIPRKGSEYARPLFPLWRVGSGDETYVPLLNTCKQHKPDLPPAVNPLLKDFHQHPLLKAYLIVMLGLIFVQSDPRLLYNTNTSQMTSSHTSPGTSSATLICTHAHVCNGQICTHAHVCNTYVMYFFAVT